MASSKARHHSYRAHGRVPQTHFASDCSRITRGGEGRRDSRLESLSERDGGRGNHLKAYQRATWGLQLCPHWVVRGLLLPSSASHALHSACRELLKLGLMKHQSLQQKKEEDSLKSGQWNERGVKTNENHLFFHWDGTWSS